MADTPTAAEIEFGSLLRRCRDEAGLNSQRLAELLFVRRESVDRYIRGERRPTLETVTRWAEICGTEPDALGAAHRALPPRRRSAGERADVDASQVTGQITDVPVTPHAPMLDLRDPDRPRVTEHLFGADVEALCQLGAAMEDIEEYEAAADCYWQALETCRTAGERLEEALVLDCFANLAVSVNQPEQAVGFYEESAEIARELGRRGEEAGVLLRLGLVLADDLGNWADAIEQFETSAAIYSELGDPLAKARALTYLALAERTGGYPALAENHLREALRTFRRLRAPEAKVARAWLASYRPSRLP